MRDRAIIKAFDNLDVPSPDRAARVIGYATPVTVVGRIVTDWSSSCGTYGMGGPGFFGLHFEDGEWLILCLWNAASWLEVEHPPAVRRMVEAQHSTPQAAAGLLDQLSGRDDLSPLLGLPRRSETAEPAGRRISAFNFSGHQGTLTFAPTDTIPHETSLLIAAEPERRSLWATGAPRAFAPEDDLANGWIIATQPWVNV